MAKKRLDSELEEMKKKGAKLREELGKDVEEAKTQFRKQFGKMARQTQKIGAFLEGFLKDPK